jgi:hypothetical protein
VFWAGWYRPKWTGGEYNRRWRESLEHRQPHHPDKQQPFPDYASQTNMIIINESERRDLLLDRFSHWLRPPPSRCRDWFYGCNRYFLMGRVRKQWMFLNRWGFRLAG